MDISSVPTLADAIKEYYASSELEELDDLFAVGLEFDDEKPAYMKIARTLIARIEYGNNRRFLETLMPSLVSRCRERIAHTEWERQDYHRQMLARLLVLVNELEEGKIPTEITISEEHPFTAKSEAREFLGNADTEVTIVDNYVGVGTLDCLRDVHHSILLLTGVRSNSTEPGFDRALKDFQLEGYTIEVRCHSKLHDRYILFNDRCWLVGSSLKDAGKKTFSIIEIVDSKTIIVAEIRRKWNEAGVIKTDQPANNSLNPTA